MLRFLIASAALALALVVVAHPAQPMPSVTATGAPVVFVSLGMPTSQLRALLAEAAQVGAAVVIRGLYRDDFKSTVARIREITEAVTQNGAQQPGLSIDPTLFRRFRVITVPTFVLPLEPLKPCTPDGCATPEHVQASGSATLRYFLDLINRTGKQQAREVAEVWLQKYAS